MVTIIFVTFFVTILVPTKNVTRLLNYYKLTTIYNR